jgi:aspartyl-tRNA(Asn)/glutamyl-tRNA(Gln) amidotransferase subunit A
MTAAGTTTDVAWLSAHELLDAYATKALSPVEVTKALLDRIDAVDGPLNAWCHLDPETTLAQARDSEERWHAGTSRGTLDGVPVAVKDVFLTAGWPTLKGSLNVDPEQDWTDDAPAVAALRRHGAVLLGKTTTPEYGWKAVTDAPAYGVTRNPWNPDRTPGGSSGGSSAALMSGTAPLALGTDGGGSIRIPAGFSGHVGIKPTWGRVPHWPAPPYGTLAHAGPMARTVADTALLLNALSEPDPRDAAALLPVDSSFLETLEGSLGGITAAFSPTLGFVDVDAEVAAAVRAAVDALADEGLVVTEKDPGFDDPVTTYQLLWNTGAAQATRSMTAEQRERMDPGLVDIVEDGARHSAVDYLDAVADRNALALTMSLFCQEYDLLLTPTLPIPAFAAGRNVPEGWHSPHWPTWTPFSYPFNMTGQPAASVPCGFTGDGLPIGLQIVGVRGADALVLRAARCWERLWPDADRHPNLQEE